MNEFVLEVKFVVKPESLALFNQLIDINAHASVEHEEGCYQFDVLRDSKDECQVLLYEVYKSEEAFADHMTRKHTQEFLAAAKPLIASQTASRWTRYFAPKVKNV